MIYIIMLEYILILLLSTQVNGKEFIPYESHGGRLLQALRQNPVATNPNFVDTGSDNAPQISQYISNDYLQSMSLRPGNGNVVFPSIFGEQPIMGEQHTLDRPNHPLVQSHIDELISTRPYGEQHFLTRPQPIISTSSGQHFLPHLVSTSPLNSKYDEFHSPIARPQIIVNAENIYLGNQRVEHLPLHIHSDKDLAPLAPARHYSTPLKMPFMYHWLTEKSPSLTARPSFSDQTTELVSQKFNMNSLLARIKTENNSDLEVGFLPSPFFVSTATDKPNDKRPDNDTKHNVDEFNKRLDPQNVGHEEFMPLMGSSNELLSDVI